MSWLSRHAATSRRISISQDPCSQVEGHQEDGQEGLVKNGEIKMPLLGHIYTEMDKFYRKIYGRTNISWTKRSVTAFKKIESFK